VFDLVYVMTQGGPGDATNVLQFYGYKKTFAEGMIGYGSAIAVTVFLLSLTLALVYLHALRTSRWKEARAVKRTAALALFSVGIALYCLVPFVWFVLTSLKSGTELTAIPPTLLPSFHLSFYRLGTEELRFAALHLQQHHRRRLSHSAHRRDRFAGGIRDRAFSVEGGRISTCFFCSRFPCFHRSPSPVRSGRF
jgi:hypothetical protein